MKTRYEIEKIGLKSDRIITTLQFVCMVAIVVSLFVWIWGTWELALKIAVSSSILLAVLAFAKKVFKMTIADLLKTESKGESVDNAPDRIFKKSKFHLKLEEMEREKQKNKAGYGSM